MKIVFQKLAQQLVEEQVELVKREAVVQGLKKTIREKKLSVIKKRVEDRLLQLDGKKGLVVLLECDDFLGSMRFVLHLGLDPNDAVRDEAVLTQKERELLQQYKHLFFCKAYNLDEEIGRELQRVASKLWTLKHGINLLIPYAWNIPYDDATQPDFFEKTSLEVDRHVGPSDQRMMIEDCLYRVKR